jgi:mRNA interferase RelE/StbE
MYTVNYTLRVLQVLESLDRPTRALLMAWIEKNLIGCDDPRSQGKALSARSADMWRYRIGDYRLIAEISDETITILALNVGHHKEVYEALVSRA